MKRVNHGRKKFMMPLLVGVGLLFLIGGVYVYNADPFNSSQCRGKSSSPIYEEAAQVLKNYDSVKAEALVKKIKDQSGYETDVNCVYPVFYYLTKTEQFTEARDELSNLRASIFKPGSRVSELYKELGFSEFKNAQEQLDNAVNEESKNLNRLYF